MIWNKNNKGNEELKAALGFINKSLQFPNISPFIPLAKRMVLHSIPKAMYEKIEDYYQNVPNTPDDLMDEILKNLHTAEALYAYSRYAPSNDLIHSDVGRQISVAETQKPAFEWQIQKDDKNIIELAWDFMDIVIDLLQQSNYSEWKDSDILKKISGRFIKNAQDFSNIIYINNSNRVFMMLAPIMESIEKQKIEPCFLPETWAALKQHMAANSLSDIEKEYVIKAQFPVAFYTIQRAIKAFDLELLPEGIFKNSIYAKSNADIMDKSKADKYYEQNGDLLLLYLQEEISKYISSPSTITSSQDVTKKPFFRA